MWFSGFVAFPFNSSTVDRTKKSRDTNKSHTSTVWGNPCLPRPIQKKWGGGTYSSGVLTEISQNSVPIDVHKKNRREGMGGPCKESILYRKRKGPLNGFAENRNQKKSLGEQTNSCGNDDRQRRFSREQGKKGNATMRQVTQILGVAAQRNKKKKGTSPVNLPEKLSTKKKELGPGTVAKRKRKSKESS